MKSFHANMELPKLHPTMIAGIIQDNPLSLSRSDEFYDFDRQARTILMISASVGAVKCVEFLIEAGARVQLASPTDEKTALHLACAAGPKRRSAEIVAALIKAGADPTALDSDGHRPTDLLATASNEVSSVLSFLYCSWSLMKLLLVL